MLAVLVSQNGYGVKVGQVRNAGEKLPIRATAQIGACGGGLVGVKGRVASSYWARGRKPYWWRVCVARVWWAGC